MPLWPRRDVLSLGAVLLLVGCAPLFRESIEEFNKGFTAAKDTIADRAQAMDAVKRRKVFEATFYTDQHPVKPDDPKLQAFSVAACAASEYLSKQQAALGALGSYNKTLEMTNEVPKEKIPALLKSIMDNWSDPDALKPREASQRTDLACTTEIQNLVAMPLQTVPEFAPLAYLPLLETGEKLLKAVERVTIFGLGMIDDFVRGRKIRRYVIESQEVVKVALDDLDQPDAAVSKICQSFGFRPPCRGEKNDKGEVITYSRLDGVTIAQKWAALRKPWHLYLAMYGTQRAYVDSKARLAGAADPKAVSADALWYLLDKQQDEFADALRDYRTLASNPSAGDIARSLRKANDTLVRLSRGEVTPAEAWAVLKEYARRAKEIKDDVTTLTDSKETITKQLKDIEEKAKAKANGP